MTTKFNEPDKNKILVKLDYENFYKILLYGGLSYENEWDDLS